MSVQHPAARMIPPSRIGCGPLEISHHLNSKFLVERLRSPAKGLKDAEGAQIICLSPHEIGASLGAAPEWNTPNSINAEFTQQASRIELIEIGSNRGTGASTHVH